MSSSLAALALALFLAGLMGGVHCAGMCGGLVSALSMPRGAGSWQRLAALHLGRIAGYAILGAGAGALGAGSLLSARFIPVQLTLYVTANLLLLAVGMHQLGWTAPLARVEHMGSALWRRLTPVTRHFLPADTPRRALAVGALWGFMPCGLVYGALALALLTGSVIGGAVAMTAFGIGTLPNLLTATLILRKLAKSAWRRLWQRLLGLTVLAFGVYGLAHATWLTSPLQSNLFCLTLP